MLEKGIYEELVNLWLKGEIESSRNEKISTDKVESDGSSRLLSIYVAERLQSALEYMKDNNINLSSRIKFVNELIEKINLYSETSRCNEIIDPPEMLVSVDDNSYISKNPKNTVTRPVTSIAYSSLFTGSISEPRLYSELKLEILTSDSIDMLVSFIKWSGLRLILNELKSFTERGGSDGCIFSIFTEVRIIINRYQHFRRVYNFIAPTCFRMCVYFFN